MKKLLALIALVAMVAVSSVTYGASADVSGTLGETTDLQDCTGATFLALATHGTPDTAACTGTMIWNTLPGYQLKYNAVTADLDHTNAVDKLAGGAACTTTECFSYKFVSTDDEDTPVAGQIVEHMVPTVATVQTAGITWEGNYGFEFYAVTETDTPAGTYSSDGTVTINVAP